MYHALETCIRDALARASVAYEGAITFDRPELSFGDYTTNIALVVGALTRANPRALADTIAAGLTLPEGFESVSVAGPGFLNFTLSRAHVVEALLSLLDEGESIGKGSVRKGERVMVEHTQPNPFKPFHIGHLMSNTLGESISRLVENTGAEVRRANWQGDVGLHVAKALWGLRDLQGDPSQIEDVGRAYVHGNSAYEEREDARAEIVELNKKIYARDPSILEAYETGRSVSLEHFEELYRILGTTFDYYFFESEGAAPGRALVKEGLADGVFTESDGAVVFRGEEYGLHTRVFLTKEGLPTYEAKELGLAHLKAEKWDFDSSLTTTAVEQAEYFKVVWKALSLIRPALAAKMEHKTHGMMQLTEGKMSSRKGNIITGESLITEMRTLARVKVGERDLPEEEKEHIATAVAIAAIKYSILKQKAGKNIIFKPEEALSFEGDSGPYLQYSYTRAQSVLRKAEEAGVAPGRGLPPGTSSDLERLLPRFGEVAQRAAQEYEPHFLTTYLTELASAFNSWYAHEKILDGSPESPYRLAVAAVFAHTMRKGLWCLGIEAPDRM